MQAIAVVNALVPEEVVRHYAEAFEIERAEPGAISGKEMAADEILLNRLLLAIAAAREPGILVLLTGDGAGAGRGLGFLPLIIEARRRGFAVEVFGWRDYPIRAWSSSHPWLARSTTSTTLTTASRSSMAASGVRGV